MSRHHKRHIDNETFRTLAARYGFDRVRHLHDGIALVALREKGWTLRGYVSGAVRLIHRGDSSDSDASGVYRSAKKLELALGEIE